MGQVTVMVRFMCLCDHFGFYLVIFSSGERWKHTDLEVKQCPGKSYRLHGRVGCGNKTCLFGKKKELT